MGKFGDIEPVGRTKVFTGEYRLYKDMSELNKYINEVDVYSEDQVLKILEPFKESLKNLVDANDNLNLNIDGRGDLWRALDNAREVLNAH